MRYKINFDKTINQLVPYYIGGRKLILYLQALMKPIQELSNAFSEYAKEQRIETAMTSQIFYFEWFLNRKFSKYFLNGGQITIKNGERLGALSNGRTLMWISQKICCCTKKKRGLKT